MNPKDQQMDNKKNKDGLKQGSNQVPDQADKKTKKPKTFDEDDAPLYSTNNTLISSIKQNGAQGVEGLINDSQRDPNLDGEYIFQEEDLEENLMAPENGYANHEPQKQFFQEKFDVERPKIPEFEENDSEDEGIEDYKIGGYHPIHIGYVVIQKLGWGHFSTVWLCKDFKFDTYVALKIQKSAANYMEAAYDEVKVEKYIQQKVEILQRVARNALKPEWIESMKEYYKDEGKTEFTRDDCHVVQLLNSFIYQGPYGNHFCMVFEIMGVNLLEIIKRYEYKGVNLPQCGDNVQVPLHLVRRIAKQILIGLDYLHRMCNLIHTDLKPENILLCLTPEEINDIVENGQLSRNKDYAERIKQYQIKHGIIPPDAALSNQENIPNKKESKAQTHKIFRKKNQRPKSEKHKPFLFDENFDGEEEPLSRHSSLPSQLHRKARFEAEPRHSHQHDIHDKDNEIHFSSKALSKNDKRGPKLREDFQLKIVDLGNACWKHHHFSTEIQTRQYRSPEVILGIQYNETADIWSLACTIFEMLTGDFLFEPKKGQNFDKDDDHLAQMIELISRFPKKFAVSGINSKLKKFFDKKGRLRKIQGFHFWPLRNVLIEKYHLREEEARMLSNFIMPMLRFYPEKRISAREALSNPWLKMPKYMNYKMTEEEIRKRVQVRERIQDIGFSSQDEGDSEVIQGDQEDNTSYIDSNFSFGDHDNYGYDDFLHTSFQKTGYVPYGGGINMDDLDQDPNWQFIDADKIIYEEQEESEQKKQ